MKLTFQSAIWLLVFAALLLNSCNKKESPGNEPEPVVTQKKYKCTDGKCEESEQGVYNSVQECQDACPQKYSTVTDVKGKEYKTVRIGNQHWMAENLAVNSFNDGTAIPFVSNRYDWTGTNLPALAHNWNQGDYIDRYGYLYNFYVVKSAKNVCPAGWHIPTKEEWDELINHLSGNTVAGEAMKDSVNLWSFSSKKGNNSSGFSGLPGGHRETDDKASFTYISSMGFWWSSTNVQNLGGYGFRLLYNDYSAKSGQYSNNMGLCIRCIED